MKRQGQMWSSWNPVSHNKTKLFLGPLKKNKKTLLEEEKGDLVLWNCYTNFKFVFTNQTSTRFINCNNIRLDYYCIICILLTHCAVLRTIYVLAFLVYQASYYHIINNNISIYVLKSLSKKEAESTMKETTIAPSFKTKKKKKPPYHL